MQISFYLVWGHNLNTGYEKIAALFTLDSPFPSSVSLVFGRGKCFQGQSPVNKVTEASLRFGFWPKTHRCVRWCVIMVQNLWLVFPQFYAFLMNCFAQSAHNFKVTFLIDRTTLWQEFIMHRAVAIEENSEQNIHIWSNLTSLFRLWLFWTLPLEWLVTMS